MKGRWLFAAVLAGCGFAAGYMAVKTEDQGRWLFVVFALFFLILAFAGFRPARPPAGQPAPPARTGFAPHWMMLLAMVVLGAALLAGAWQLLHR